MPKLKPTLNKADFDLIYEVITTVVDQKLEEKLEQKLEEKLEEKLEQKFEEKLKYLPSKEEFYAAMDAIMGELKAMREELTVLSYHSSEHHDRIESLEKIHPNYSHK